MGYGVCVGECLCTSECMNAESGVEGRPLPAKAKRYIWMHMDGDVWPGALRSPPPFPTPPARPLGPEGQSETMRQPPSRFPRRACPFLAHCPIQGPSKQLSGGLGIRLTPSGRLTRAFWVQTKGAAAAAAQPTARSGCLRELPRGYVCWTVGWGHPAAASCRSAKKCAVSGEVRVNARPPPPSVLGLGERGGREARS
jgi:hypothetical protein